MSRSAFTAKVFAVYLFVVGALLVVAPNFLLSLFLVASTTEVWIRVLGVVAFNLGVYAWIAARHEDRPFLEASVYTRLLVFASFAVFAATRLASPMIVLFGVVDLCGALWTHVALKTDHRARGASFAPARTVASASSKRMIRLRMQRAGTMAGDAGVGDL